VLKTGRNSLEDAGLRERGVARMSIWKQLYAMVWLAFLQIVIITLPRFTIYLVDGHVALGLVILALAHYDNALIKKTAAPNRLKRIVKSTAILATFQIILGVILYANLRLNVSVPVVSVISFIHLVTALAIITQAASVATAYDMWEEHEYTASRKSISNA
jgi:heme A synthase